MAISLRGNDSNSQNLPLNLSSSSSIGVRSVANPKKRWMMETQETRCHSESLLILNFYDTISWNFQSRGPVSGGLCCNQVPPQISVPYNKSLVITLGWGISHGSAGVQLQISYIWPHFFSHSGSQAQGIAAILGMLLTHEGGKHKSTFLASVQKWVRSPVLSGSTSATACISPAADFSLCLTPEIQVFRLLSGQWMASLHWSPVSFYLFVLVCCMFYIQKKLSEIMVTTDQSEIKEYMEWQE